MTLLTREQADFIYKVCKSLSFNFGSVVVNNISRAATKGKPSHILPFPSLIYRLLKAQGYQPPKEAVLVRDSTLLSFEKVFIFSDKRIRYLPFKLPPLSRADSEGVIVEADVSIDVDSEADVGADVGPSSSNINTGEATQLISLIIQKLEDEVFLPLRRLRTALNPAII